MVFVENGSIDQIPNVLLVALSEVEHGLGVSLGGLAKTLSLRIFANTLENRSYSPREFLNPLFILFRRRLQPLPCSRAWVANLERRLRKAILEMSLTRPAESVKVNRWIQCIRTGRAARGRRWGQWTTLVSGVARWVVQRHSTTTALSENNYYRGLSRQRTVKSSCRCEQLRSR